MSQLGFEPNIYLTQFPLLLATVLGYAIFSCIFGLMCVQQQLILSYGNSSAFIEYLLYFRHCNKSQEYKMDNGRLGRQTPKKFYLDTVRCPRNDTYKVYLCQQKDLYLWFTMNNVCRPDTVSPSLTLQDILFICSQVLFHFIYSKHIDY